MSKIGEVLVSVLMPAIKSVGKAELKEVLSGIKQHNTPELYKNTLQGMYSDFLLLREGALKTKSKIDDGIVDVVLEAVQESAAADNIVLS